MQVYFQNSSYFFAERETQNIEYLFVLHIVSSSLTANQLLELMCHLAVKLLFPKL